MQGLPYADGYSFQAPSGEVWCCGHNRHRAADICATCGHGRVAHTCKAPHASYHGALVYVAIFIPCTSVVQEEVETNFKSKTDGIMHACGHDTHMAMLLGGKSPGLDRDSAATKSTSHLRLVAMFESLPQV